MASDWKPVLDCQTGRVTDLASHQGKMFARPHEICFTHGVVIMPNSEPTPFSLLDCMKVGDALHYNARLTINPATQQPTYVATRVWFPNTKNKGAEEPAPAQPTMKALRKQISRLLKVRGLLTVEQLLSELGSLGPESCKLYGSTLEGLRTFVAYHKAHFRLVDGRVGLVKGGKPLVQNTVQVLKTLLRPLGSTSLSRLFELLQGCDEDVRNFIFSTKALHSFLETHPGDFMVLKDGTVYAIEEPLQRTESPKAAEEEDPRLADILRRLASLLSDMERLSLYELFEELQKSAPDALQAVGTKPNHLLKLLVRCPGSFVVHPNQMVQLIQPAEAGSRTGAGPKADSSVPKSAKHPADNGLSAKSVDFVRSVLTANGPLNVNQLMVWVVGAPTEVSKHIGSTHDALTAFLKGSKAFHITDDGTVQCRKAKSAGSLEQSPLPRHHRGPVLTVGPQFGFVRHGTAAHDNIFFDAEAYMEPTKNLKLVLAPGDQVDCLFVDVQPGKRKKFQAVAVWKVPEGDSGPGDAPSELVALPDILPSPVYYGEANVALVAGDLGYCCPHGGGNVDSLIEFEEGDKAEPALITFHFSHLVGQQDPGQLRTRLKKGARVMFLARPCPVARDAPYPVHWSAVSLWLKPNGPAAAPQDQQSVTAEVQELTSEGGTLSFGPNPWANGITFSWKQVMSRADKLFDRAARAGVGDTFWCIVASGQMARDPCKWVAVELFPCNLDMVSRPPARYQACPAVALPRAASPLCPGNSRKDSTEQDLLLDLNDDGDAKGVFAPKTDVPETVTGVDKMLSGRAAIAAENDVPEVVPANGKIVSGRATGAPETDVPETVTGIGKMVSKDNYGGILESDVGDVLKFSAHAFFYDGRPVSHLAFPVGTQVHFEGRRTEGFEMLADIIWIGKRPLLSSSQ